MWDTIAEADWKLLRRLREAALERFCEQALRRVDRITADSNKTYHARYLEIWRALREEDKDLAEAFNGARRSIALMQLTAMRRKRLLTDSEFAQFSEETRRMVEAILTPGPSAGRRRRVG